MTAKSEYDAAYFTLLRAREERDALQRYAEFLETELAAAAAFPQVADVQILSEALGCT